MVVLVGVFIGFVLGLTGSGGSVFAVPLLSLLLGFSIQQAVGLSLGAVAASAIFGVLLKIRTGHINWLVGTVFLLFGSLATPVGVWLNRRAEESLLLIGFSFLLIIVAWRMWRQASAQPDQAEVVRVGLGVGEPSQAMCRYKQSAGFSITPSCLVAMGAAAIATGILSGLFGVGGGFLIVPVLLAITNMSIHQAVATSLLIIASISSVGFINFLWFSVAIDQQILLWLVAGGVVGMVLGIFTSRYLAGPFLQKLFALLLLIILAVTWFKL